MNHTKKSALAILLIVGLSVPTWFLVVAVEHDPPRAAVRDLGPIPVRSLRLERLERTPLVEVFGNLEARRRAVITAGVTARIVSVDETWQPGAQVAKGQVLVRLDPVDFELDLRSRGARLAEAQARLRTAEVHTQRARANETMGRQLLAVAQREHQRLSSLEGEGAESRSRLDRALSERLSAELTLETASLEVESADAAQETAKAGVDLASAATELARQNLDDCTVRAPFAGRLVGPAPSLGTSARPGLSLGELVDAESLVLAAQVSERDLLRISLGAAATIDFPSLGDFDALEIPARVGAVDAASDGVIRHARVEIEPLGGLREFALEGGEGKQRWLPTGLFARAEIRLEARDSIWVERRHLVWEGDEAACFVSRQGPEGTRTSKRLALRLGAPHDEGFFVEAGLVEGDELLTHPLERLFDGAQITEAQASPVSSSETSEASGR